MTILAKVLSGSRLYGLDGPSSDWDHKSIHLPSLRDCLLLRAPRNVHVTGDINGVKAESESFALQEFLALASRGEDVAITTLHVGDKDVIETSSAFEELTIVD